MGLRERVPLYVKAEGEGERSRGRGAGGGGTCEDFGGTARPDTKEHVQAEKGVDFIASEQNGPEKILKYLTELI